MRKLRVVLATAVAICGLVTASQAAFVFKSSTTFTGSITTTGGTTWAQATLSDKTSAINWGSVNLGSTGWKIASNYIVLYSTLTNAGSGTTGGIQIYTNNRYASYPKYTNANSSISAAGLVVDQAPDISPLPMSWRISDSTASFKGIVQGSDNNLYDSELGESSKYPCWLWMMDKSTIANKDAGITNGFTNGDDYVTVKDAVRGMHHAGGDNWAKTVSPDYIYLGANFAGALGGQTYGTTLCVELFTE